MLCAQIRNNYDPQIFGNGTKEFVFTTTHPVLVRHARAETPVAVYQSTVGTLRSSLAPITRAFCCCRDLTSTCVRRPLSFLPPTPPAAADYAVARHNERLIILNDRAVGTICCAVGGMCFLTGLAMLCKTCSCAPLPSPACPRRSPLAFALALSVTVSTIRAADAVHSVLLSASLCCSHGLGSVAMYCTATELPVRRALDGHDCQAEYTLSAAVHVLTGVLVREVSKKKRARSIEGSQRSKDDRDAEEDKASKKKRRKK